MEEYGKRNTFELKNECAKRKLSTSGKKIPLVKRLVNDDIQKRNAHLANVQSLAFNRYNDPDGTKRRQFIEQEYGFKLAALYVVTEAEIDYYSNLVEQARADRNSGKKNLMAERTQALLAVDESLKTYPQAMEVSCSRFRSPLG